MTKILAEHVPKSQEDWLECINAAHCKNQLIQVYGMTPSQFVLGKNPRVPENLLDEPLEAVPATASLYESAVAKQVAIRQTARRAVLELQDSKALRLALAARFKLYRPSLPVRMSLSGGHRTGFMNHSRRRTGRWWGPALVLGYV